MNHFSRKAVLLTSLILPFTFGAATANAAQITEWGYIVDNSFTDVEFTPGGGVTTVEDNQISWGSETEQSSISVNDVSSPPNLITNGGKVPGGNFNHDNQSIPDDTQTLASFNLNSTLELFAIEPESMEGVEAGPIPVTFESFFTETFNGEPCFEGSESTCDDVFSLANPESGQLNDEGNFELASPVFTIDDFNYTVFLEIVGLNQLTDEQCMVADAPTSCIGFLTQEGQNNTFQTNFSIESSPVSVPEPGSLALLGLGLVGLGVASRRRK
jgi:hypothetical protein